MCSALGVEPHVRPPTILVPWDESPGAARTEELKARTVAAATRKRGSMMGPVQLFEAREGRGIVQAGEGGRKYGARYYPIGFMR